MVLGRLRSRIASGEYPAGTLLPPERQLSEELGVARNTLRKALGLLEAEGLLHHEEHRGVVVSELVAAEVGGAFLLILPTNDEACATGLSPEAMALLGSTLCACGGSDLRLQLQGQPSGGAAELLSTARAGGFAGVLLIECGEESLLEALREAEMPHVVINQEHDLPGPATRVDFWGIGRHAADHLLGLGHRRLGVLTGRAGNYLYERMLAGFRGRCAEEEVYLAAEHLTHVTSCSETSRLAALEMLAGPDRPTALFCGRDVRAYGAYLAARDLGLRVPEDLSLVGYDDITWPGQGRRFLTTFPEPTAELGRAAIVMLTAWLKTGEEPEDTVICPELVVRESTGVA
jgi:LacI family transcriptional regulator